METLIDPIIIIDGGRIVLNASLTQLGKAIRVDTGVDTPPPDAIYVEEGISGHTVLAPSDAGTEERIDLEVLFNAATSDSGRLAALLEEVSP